MTVRPLQESDIPILQQFVRASGFPYPDFDDPHIEAFLVVADSDNAPIMACAAKRLVEGYLYVSRETSPVVAIEALKKIHIGMAEQLRPLGYTSIEAFPPPSIAGKFGRRLERTWGWMKNWQSWTIRF